LAVASQSPRLRRLHEMVIGEAHLCMAQVQIRHLLHPQVIADEHARILGMIDAGDTNGASAEMDAHLQRARTRLIAHLKPEEATEQSNTFARA